MTWSHYPAPPPGLLDQELLTVFPEEPCPYLPARRSRLRGFAADRLHPLQYQRLMDRSFRRSGALFYQPVCGACRQCVPLRVPVETFAPTRSQRRVARKNQDLTVSLLDVQEASDAARDELLGLFATYSHQWHGKEDGESLRDMASYLFDSPVNTVIFCYRNADGRLLAGGLCDVCEVSLSSVYFFFDPAEQARSLGTFGALTELAYAQRHAIPYYYLGYWVEGCQAMNYKANFGPHELLGTDGQWRPAK
jgi:arginine-tRNA-protein transferase